MARRERKSAKNEKKNNTSGVNLKKGGKVVKRQPERIPVKKFVKTKVKCPKCSKLMFNFNKSKAGTCVSCLKNEANSPGKRNKSNNQVKLPPSGKSKICPQVNKDSSRKSNRINSLDGKSSAPKLSPKSSPTNTSSSRRQSSSPRITKAQASSTSKRKNSVREQFANKKQASNTKVQASLNTAKSNKKEMSESATGNKMSLRGGKRSYAQLTGGIKMEDEQHVKKRKSTKPSKEMALRESRSKKPTVKGSEWLNTIQSKKLTSPKQEKGKKETTQSPLNKKSPKLRTGSPNKEKKNISSKVRLANPSTITKKTTKSNFNSKPSETVQQIPKRQGSRSLIKQKDAQKPTPLKAKPQRITTTRLVSSSTKTVLQRSRSKVIDKRPGKKQEGSKQSKANDKPQQVTKKVSLAKSIKNKFNSCFADKNKSSTSDLKENVLVAQEILQDLLNSVGTSVGTLPSKCQITQESFLNTEITSKTDGSSSVLTQIERNQDETKTAESQEHYTDKIVVSNSLLSTGLMDTNSESNTYCGKFNKNVNAFESGLITLENVNGKEFHNNGSDEMLVESTKNPLTENQPVISVHDTSIDSNKECSEKTNNVSIDEENKHNIKMSDEENSISIHFDTESYRKKNIESIDEEHKPKISEEKNSVCIDSHKESSDITNSVGIDEEHKPNTKVSEEEYSSCIDSDKESCIGKEHKPNTKISEEENSISIDSDKESSDKKDILSINEEHKPDTKTAEENYSICIDSHKETSDKTNSVSIYEEHKPNTKVSEEEYSICIDSDKESCIGEEHKPNTKISEEENSISIDSDKESSDKKNVLSTDEEHKPDTKTAEENNSICIDSHKETSDKTNSVSIDEEHNPNTKISGVEYSICIDSDKESSDKTNIVSIGEDHKPNTKISEEENSISIDIGKKSSDKTDNVSIDEEHKPNTKISEEESSISIDFDKESSKKTDNVSIDEGHKHNKKISEEENSICIDSDKESSDKTDNVSIDEEHKPNVSIDEEHKPNTNEGEYSICIDSDKESSDKTDNVSIDEEHKPNVSIDEEHKPNTKISEEENSICVDFDKENDKTRSVSIEEEHKPITTISEEENSISVNIPATTSQLEVSNTISRNVENSTLVQENKHSVITQNANAFCGSSTDKECVDESKTIHTESQNKEMHVNTLCVEDISIITKGGSSDKSTAKENTMSTEENTVIRTEDPQETDKENSIFLEKNVLSTTPLKSTTTVPVEDDTANTTASLEDGPDKGNNKFVKEKLLITTLVDNPTNGNKDSTVCLEDTIIQPKGSHKTCTDKGNIFLEEDLLNTTHLKSIGTNDSDENNMPLEENTTNVAAQQDNTIDKENSEFVEENFVSTTLSDSKPTNGHSENTKFTDNEGSQDRATNNEKNMFVEEHILSNLPLDGKPTKENDNKLMSLDENNKLMSSDENILSGNNLQKINNTTEKKVGIEASSTTCEQDDKEELKSNQTVKLPKKDVIVHPDNSCAVNEELNVQDKAKIDILNVSMDSKIKSDNFSTVSHQSLNNKDNLRKISHVSDNFQEVQVCQPRDTTVQDNLFCDKKNKILVNDTLEVTQNIFHQDHGCSKTDIENKMISESKTEDLCPEKEWKTETSIEKCDDDKNISSHQENTASLNRLTAKNHNDLPKNNIPQSDSSLILNASNTNDEMPDLLEGSSNGRENSCLATQNNEVPSRIENKYNDVEVTSSVKPDSEMPVENDSCDSNTIKDSDSTLSNVLVTHSVQENPPIQAISQPEFVTENVEEKALEKNENEAESFVGDLSTAVNNYELAAKQDEVSLKESTSGNVHDNSLKNIDSNFCAGPEENDSSADQAAYDDGLDTKNQSEESNALEHSNTNAISTSAQASDCGIQEDLNKKEDSALLNNTSILEKPENKPLGILSTSKHIDKNVKAFDCRDNLIKNNMEQAQLQCSFETDFKLKDEHLLASSTQHGSVVKPENELMIESNCSEKANKALPNEEEVTVDDQDVNALNHDNIVCVSSKSADEENSSNMSASTNEGIINADAGIINYTDIDVGSSETCDKFSSKMEDITEDSITVDMDGESMQCNSETRSSLRMSVDEENVAMDLDPDDTAVETNPCPTFEVKVGVGNDVNMEVS